MIALPQGGKKFDDISVQSFGHNTGVGQVDGRTEVAKQWNWSQVI